MLITIAKEYTKSPGGRHISEGDYSGEDFRERILYPAYEKILKSGETLIVDLDGGYGYSPSFLEEAFGGLARKMNDHDILNKIEIISKEEPKLIDDIKRYISDSLS